MTLADINGHSVYYEDSGGAGPTVIFSHGFLMDHSMFDAQVEALKGSYRCIAWDERGFGMTDCNGPFSYWDSADDLMAVLDHAGVDEAVLVGMSQGGFLSLRAALKYPARVRGLVMIDSEAGVNTAEEIAGYQGMADMWVAEGPIPDLAAGIAALILGDGVASESWIQRWRSRPPAWFTFPFNCLVGRDDVTDRLGEIACPTLVFHGDADASISVERGKELADGVQNLAEFVVIPGAPHASNMSHPEVVNTRMQEFLKGLG